MKGRQVAIAWPLSWPGAWKEAYPCAAVPSPMCATPMLFPEIWKSVWQRRFDCEPSSAGTSVTVRQDAGGVALRGRELRALAEAFCIGGGHDPGQDQGF